ncbi:hypothetical protein BKG82_26820 [Mycobacteroides chelonae]|uniref:Uncharacterized protein n=1 Tax=Mycobacteroides chelonae TaxID=1774 RepID=A0A1S1LCX3_MYCCH|nr:hypothetical protein [Mycobacteroides chelonae]OHU47268.1 hypothetical protein BKG82_26820 [Mycobacteroides chelonae]
MSSGDPGNREIDWGNRIYEGDTVEVDYDNPYAPKGFRGQVMRRYRANAGTLLLTMLEVRTADGTTLSVPLAAVSKKAGTGMEHADEH